MFSRKDLVCLIIAVLLVGSFAIFPVFSISNQHAKIALCMSNCKQISVLTAVYHSMNDDALITKHPSNEQGYLYDKKQQWFYKLLTGVLPEATLANWDNLRGYPEQTIGYIPVDPQTGKPYSWLFCPLDITKYPTTVYWYNHRHHMYNPRIASSFTNMREIKNPSKFVYYSCGRQDFPYTNMDHTDNQIPIIFTDGHVERVQNTVIKSQYDNKRNENSWFYGN